MRKKILEGLRSNRWEDPRRYGAMIFLLLFAMMYNISEAQIYGPPTRYEAENGFNNGVTISTTNSGYSGSGYLTGFITIGTETKFDKGVNGVTATKMDIRYANGTGSNVTNLALYIGSNDKIADLVFPSTGNWNTWGTLTLYFNHQPNWGSNIVIKSLANVSTSVNIDYSEISVDDGTAATAATPTFGPAPGTYTATQSVTLSSATSGATIRYTVDGSTPTTSSALYSSLITVSATQTIKAISVKSGMYNSAVASASYTINVPVAATPTFSPVAGTYSAAQSVVISSTTSGAQIRYTIDGSTPTASSTLYSSPISVATSQTLKAIAIKSGMTNSAVGSVVYTITIPAAATPTFSPVAGTYSAAQSVVISSTTSGAEIRYTIDGSTPTASSTLYSSPISVATSQTIKAIAIKSGMTNSSVASAVYTISTVVAAPTFSPAAGTYTATQSVALSTSTSGAEIRYTVDGSTPTASSTLYSSAVSVASSQTLKAIAIKSGLTNSSVSTATYTINLTAATPSFSPVGGTYATAQSVIFSTTTSGAEIRYTIDGSTPTTSSTLYSSPVSVATSQTLKAIAIKSGMSNSAVANAAYTISSGGGAGYVLRQYWAGISGTSVTALTSNANYPNSPTSSSYLTSFDAPRDVAESYGQKISGYVTAPTTGSYQFWISGDDDSELWLSTNSASSNKVKIASFTGWTNPIQFDKYGSQASASISLVAGTQYYIEALHKENDGGDHLSVAWQIPGGSQVIIPGSALSTTLVVPIPQPGLFNQSLPAAGATSVSTTPAFSWGASSDAVTYSLVVSTSASFASPVINVTGLTTTSYTPSAGLAGNTVYYWKVTAVNTSGTRVATNAGISFTTLIPPTPGVFSQTAPANAATGISTYPTFTWAGSSNAASYSLVVSTSSSFASPIINVSGLTTASYSPASPLAVNTLYYWKVTATNGTGSTIATNAGISFTTAASSGTTYYVTIGGSNTSGDGTSGNPWRTVAYAASQVTAGTGNKTISVGPGTFVETQAIKLALGVNILGAGESNTTITASGAIPLDQGVDGSSSDFKLWHDGSLIQLVSTIYTGANPRYGSPAEMIAPANGTQTLSGFTMDGNSKTVKAGVWVLNRSNVTLHHVTFRNFQQRGAVFTRGDMYWYQPIPAGKWMQNTTVYNCTFTNSSADIGGESTGNLCLGGLDGANIYNITVNENQGYGIKFIHVGHLRNVKIHDCNITVPETDPDWGEDISIELWNFSYDNEIYNIVCNTWLSLVNHPQFNDYQPTVAKPSNVKVYNVRMVDGDGSSGKEAIECALSGAEIYDSYFQDKGFGVAIWGGTAWGGTIAIHDVVVRNNIFTNVNRPIAYGFGNSAAVFIPDPANTIKIYNNVFDKLGNALQLNGGSGIEVKNNVFQNSGGDDVQGGSSISFTNNLRYHTDPLRQTWVVSTTLGTGNVIGNPGFQNSGSRWDTYYKPSSASSFVVDKGTNVGIPFVGSNPDIGRWEYGSGGGGGRIATSSPVEEITPFGEDIVKTYPNPTTGILKIEFNPVLKVEEIQVTSLQGKTLITKTKDQLKTNEVDLSQYPNDLYLLRIIHSKGVFVKKIIIVH